MKGGGFVIIPVTRRCLLGLFFVMLCFFSVCKCSSAAWTIQAVDAPKNFYGFYSRAIAVDTNKHPHIAYGGDHLYYAYYNSGSWQYDTNSLSNIK